MSEVAYKTRKVFREVAGSDGTEYRSDDGWRIYHDEDWNLENDQGKLVNETDNFGLLFQQELPFFIEIEAIDD